MTRRTQIPISLYFVAGFFIVTAVYFVFQAVAKWRAGVLWVPFDALSIPMAIGLLRRRRGWHTFARWILSLEIIFLIPYLVWLLLSRQPVERFAVLYLVGYTAATIWSFFVLTRTDVVALYARNTA